MLSSESWSADAVTTGVGTSSISGAAGVDCATVSGTLGVGTGSMTWAGAGTGVARSIQTGVGSSACAWSAAAWGEVDQDCSVCHAS